MIKILLDTTFILPFFGIKIRNISPEVLVAIESAKNVDFVYPKLAIPELIAKIAKECRKKNKCPEELQVYLEEFLAESDITLVEPTIEQILLAMELKREGHPDIFDCIMYATAKTENALLLTIDREFLDFLARRGFNIDIIVNEKKFLELLEERKFG